MAAGLAGELVGARAVGPVGPTLGWGVGRVSGSGGGMECDLVAERFELADEPAGSVLGGVAAGEPVGAELAGGDTVADDVVVGDQDVVPGRADRLVGSPPSADLPVVGGEVGVLAAGGGMGCLGQGRAEPGVAVAGLAGVASAA